MYNDQEIDLTSLKSTAHNYLARINDTVKSKQPAGVLVGFCCLKSVLLLNWASSWWLQKTYIGRKISIRPPVIGFRLVIRNVFESYCLELNWIFFLVCYYQQRVEWPMHENRICIVRFMSGNFYAAPDCDEWSDTVDTDSVSVCVRNLYWYH